MSDPTVLPDGLPEPPDDGAAAHVLGSPLPAVELRVAQGGAQALSDFPTRWLVLYAYPRTGGPGIDLPADWDVIPGARGCTPQSCAFRDHHRELGRLDATVWGVSAQPIEEQAAFAERMHIPFPLLNDRELTLARRPLCLPTFEAAGRTLFRRVTLIADASGVRHVFYPVFPPDRNAADVLGWLTEAG